MRISNWSSDVCSSDLAPQALFLVGERDHADRALRLERLEQRAGGHGDGDAGGVVYRAGAQVPGVEVAGEQDHFVRALPAGHLADHVLRGVLALETAVERAAPAARAQRAPARAIARQGVVAGTSGSGRVECGWRPYIHINTKNK